MILQSPPTNGHIHLASLGLCLPVPSCTALSMTKQLCFSAIIFFFFFYFAVELITLCYIHGYIFFSSVIDLLFNIFITIFSFPMYHLSGEGKKNIT